MHRKANLTDAELEIQDKEYQAAMGYAADDLSMLKEVQRPHDCAPLRLEAPLSIAAPKLAPPHATTAGHTPNKPDTHTSRDRPGENSTVLKCMA